jgi:hypothetical protein
MIRLEAGNDAMGSVLWIEALVIITLTSYSQALACFGWNHVA